MLIGFLMGYVGLLFGFLCDLCFSGRLLPSMSFFRARPLTPQSLTPIPLHTLIVSTLAVILTIVGYQKFSFGMDLEPLFLPSIRIHS